MRLKKILKRFFKTTLVFSLITILTATPVLPGFTTPVTPKQTLAACQGGGSSGGGSNLKAKVGGVALDQAATFLANMDDITGAYYDSTLDRIVFVGKTNTSLPEFDKDDLAVAIKAVIFNKSIPAVSIEDDPANPGGPNKKVFYYGGIENTKFGKVLYDADVKLKKYVVGYDENQQTITSSVPGYKPMLQRYIDLGHGTGYSNSASRFWITPKLITLKKDDITSSFVFDNVTMEVKTEAQSPDNDPVWNQAMTDFVQHHTDNYDLFAQEAPAYADAKQLGKIVAVIKWLGDNGIATDFHWAKDYAPKITTTPISFAKLTSPEINHDGHTHTISGGVEYFTPNTYNQDNGASEALKNASEAVNAPKEEIHWTFSEGGQSYESVAVAADAFRSLGSYNTASTDMAFPMEGDLALTFNRSYSSFSGGQNGIGRGWNFIPATLVDNKPVPGGAIKVNCSGHPYIHRYKLAFQMNGARETFTYDCDINGGSYIPDEGIFHSVITDAKPGPSQDIFITVTQKNQTQYIFQDIYNDPDNTTIYNLRLHQIKDKNGNTITYNYDSADKKKLLSITDNNGHTITLNYNSDNLISSVQDWSGRTVNYTYDTQGNLLTVTDPRGNITTYTYDANYKLTSITDREGTTIVENTYTPEAKIATQTDTADITSTYTYDEAQKTVTVADELGRTEQVTYDDKARILQQKDALNNNATYTYGTEYAPLTITDKNSNTITNTYDSNGNLTSTTYPDNKQITYTYDSKNNVTQIQDNRYGATPKTTTFTYDIAGNLIEQNEAGLITTYTYNTNGERITLTDPRNHLTSWTRDNFGNPLTETDANNNISTFEYDTVARLTKKTDPLNKTEDYTYDPNGNLLTILNAAGTTTNIYDKENRMTKTTLPNSSVTDYTYNNSGSLSSVKDALNNTTTYGYDAYQNLTSQQNALLKVTSHEYDALNRKTETTTPLGKISAWEYDANGNITKRTDANSDQTLYEYDAFNRLKKITYPNLDTTNYTYDNRGNLTQMVDPQGTTTYAYDNHDRLLTVSNPFSQQISYTYDNTGNLTKITYPDNKEVNYSYDNANRLSGVVDWNTDPTNYSYFNNGLLATKTLPNGIVSSYTYDNANRLASLTHVKNSTTLAKFTYERNPVGNITKVTEEGTFFPTPTPPPGPDLVITEAYATPASPTVNTNFDVTIRVKNQGTLGTGFLIPTFAYYKDPATPPDYTTFPNSTYGTNIDLDPGEEVLIIRSMSFSTTGTHTIWILADRQQILAEQNENNNLYESLQVEVVSTPQPTATPTPTPPPPTATPTPTQGPTPTLTPGKDLVITGISTTPVNPSAGSTYTLSIKVKNQGTVGTGTIFVKIPYWYDRTSLPTITSTYSYSLNTTMNLNAGQETTINITSPPAFSTSGAHTIWAFVDRDNSVIEANENNNAYGPHNVTVNPAATPTPTPTAGPTATPTPTPPAGSKPDLVQTSITLTPAVIHENGEFDIAVNVKNQGAVATSAPFKVGFYYDRASAPSPSSYDDSETWISNVAVNQEVTLTERFVEFNDPGSHNIWIRVDREGSINESDEVNNVFGPYNVNVLAGGQSNFAFFKDFLPTLSALFVPTASAQTPPIQYVTTFTYDALSRLTQANYHDEKQYDFAYNSIDNRTSLISSISGTLSTTNYTYDDDSRLALGGAETFTYDNKGNQTAINNSTRDAVFNFNFENRLVSHDPTNGDTTSYLYDGLFNRLAKTVGTTTTRFVNDISGDLSNVIAETDNSNAIQKSYVYGTGLISQGQSAANSRDYILEDGEGNVRFITDESGNKLSYYAYQPYGGLRVGQESDGLLYQTQQLDNESGLYHLRARQYDPTTGRFISVDPVKGILATPQSLNPYQYTYNNPINLSDPSGLIVFNQSDQTILVKAEKESDGYKTVAPHTTYPGSQDGIIYRDGSIYKNNEYVDIAVTNTGVSNATPADAIINTVIDVAKAGYNAIPFVNNVALSGSYKTGDGSLPGTLWQPQYCW